jgi:hypothetical protein
MPTRDNKPLFLFGNGLSIALSPEFSLKRITNKFISSLTGDMKAYLCELCGGEANLNFDDFELNFSLLEDAYGSLKKYRRFIETSAGQLLLTKFNLPNPDLLRHEEIIKSLYDEYIFQILGLIHGNVTKVAILQKLDKFSAFLKNQLENCSKGYVFTLNYDLLAETILLEEIGSGGFTDFCSPTGHLKGTQIEKYDFDPALNEARYGEDYTSSNIELHHLHGSLSMFYDYERNKAIKIKSEDILLNDVYNTIHKEKWTLYPAIITGGGKSTKMNEYPFEFYYRNFKDYSTYGKYSKLFIVGYSFRDEHINDLINRWMLGVEDYTKGLLIVDYKKTTEEQNDFKKFVRAQIKKRPMIPDSCFEFGGVNAIHDVIGTVAKERDK